jgi:hypothetical protein
MASKIVEKAKRIVSEGKVFWQSFTEAYVDGDHGFYKIVANVDDSANGWICNCEFLKHNNDPERIHCSHIWAAFLISHDRDQWREQYIQAQNNQHEILKAKEPNETTRAAIQELENEGGKCFNSVYEFFTDLNS